MKASSLRVSQMRPVPVEPRYEARFGADEHVTVLHAKEGTGLVPAPTDGRSPSFVVEAGRKLTVTPHAEMFPRDIDAIELDASFLEGPTVATLPLTDGTRDRQGQLRVHPVTLDVPENAKGTLRLRFRLLEGDHAVDTLANTVFNASVIPSHKATLVFGDDWSVTQEGTIRPAGQLELAYDAERMRSILGAGDASAELTACVSFDGAPPQWLPVSIRGANGIPLSGYTFLPALKVPDRAKQVRVWFEGEALGRKGFDSDHGQDFHFETGLPVKEADPEWRRAVRNLTRLGNRFPNLHETAYQTLGPADPSYDCVAWSLGIRDRRIEPPNENATALLRDVWKGPGPVPAWPHDRQAQFDLLYRAMGFEPLDTLDTSFVPGVEKVALFGSYAPATQKYWANHAAVMDENGMWQSKLGSEPLIEHADVNAVAGASYGELFRMYARPRP